MVEGLDLENLDKEMAQEIAVDLLPILPEVAFSLLEEAIGEVEKQSIIGGMLAFEIPEFRLPKEILKSELEDM